MVDILADPEMVGYINSGKKFYMPAWERFIEGYIGYEQFIKIAEEWEILRISDTFSEVINIDNPVKRSPNKCLVAIL